MIRIGITHGDVNGISYEVIIKSLMDARLFESCTPILYGSSKVAAYHRKALDIENFSLNSIRAPEEASQKKANVINCVDDEIRVELGKSTKAAGESSRAALWRALEDLKNNKIQAIVTGPINKLNIQSQDFNYTGHTEFLRDFFDAEDVLMLMSSDLMKIGVVTSHLPLNEVAQALNREEIHRKILILDHSLRVDFNIRKPRIAVLGLNPHAGEEGMLGSEEVEEIIPAIEEAKESGITIFGPFPADGFFGSGDFTKFDGILAMYHDQGLIPFKTLVPHEGVNYTAGLPIVRTSPAHGTAFELAGANKADPDSLRRAIYMASDIYNNRLQYKEISKNPLPEHDPSQLS